MSQDEDGAPALVERLQATLRLIERMLMDDRRAAEIRMEAYFAALKRKASEGSGANVTAEFFSSAAS